jgi:hypothetical protein
MTIVKITITTQESEVLDEFVAAPMREILEEGPISLSLQIRDQLEYHFNIADKVEDLPPAS